jgi:hypothetical protein
LIQATAIILSSKCLIFHLKRCIMLAYDSIRHSARKTGVSRTRCPRGLSRERSLPACFRFLARLSNCLHRNLTSYQCFGPGPASLFQKLGFLERPALAPRTHSFGAPALARQKLCFTQLFGAPWPSLPQILSFWSPPPSPLKNSALLSFLEPSALAPQKLSFTQPFGALRPRPPKTQLYSAFGARCPRPRPPKNSALLSFLEPSAPSKTQPLLSFSSVPPLARQNSAPRPRPSKTQLYSAFWGAARPRSPRPQFLTNSLKAFRRRPASMQVQPKWSCPWGPYSAEFLTPPRLNISTKRLTSASIFGLVTACQPGATLQLT